MTNQIINIVIDCAAQIAATVAIILITAAINYVKGFVVRKLQMQTLGAALGELDDDIAGVVGELQQTTVEVLKASAADGKLSKDEVAMLNAKLIAGVKTRLSTHALNIIAGAGVDINAYILSQGEAIVAASKAANN